MTPGPAAADDRPLMAPGKGPMTTAIAVVVAMVAAACVKGTGGQPGVSDSPTIGWAGQELFGIPNDWEPAVAADPNAPYVYMLTTRYGEPAACDGCPDKWIAMRTSSDGGKTFADPEYLCACKGEKWQADPNIEVAGDGTVFATWLTTGYDVVTTRSTDHGATWTKPKSVIGNLPWGDHPWTTVSADGRDVYIGFNRRDNYQVTSHDTGVHWSQPIQTNESDDNTYYFSEGGVVLPDDTAVFAASSYGCCPYGKFAHKRPQTVYAIRSEDGGNTWEQVEIATSEAPPLCTGDGCPKAQYGAQATVAADRNGNLIMAWNASAEPHGGQQILAATSSDGGATWSEPQELSPPGDLVAAFPEAAGLGEKLSLMWADNRSGEHLFNIWYRESVDGGSTWSPDVRLSDAEAAPEFADYISPEGFGFFYGDYGDITVTNQGKAFGVWGESGGYNGPGTTWYNWQT